MVRLSTCIDNHFVFNAPAATAIYTLSLHDALPILESLRSYEVEGAVSLCYPASRFAPGDRVRLCDGPFEGLIATVDRKSTRLNSSHLGISYAVFCLKIKNVQELMLPLLLCLTTDLI